jgi:hypothetical protein
VEGNDSESCPMASFVISDAERSVSYTRMLLIQPMYYSRFYLVIRIAEQMPVGSEL